MVQSIKVETFFIYDALLFHTEGLILCEKIAESNTGNLPLEGVGKQVKYGNLDNQNGVPIGHFK